MAITRIKNNQVTDLTLTNAKIATATITGAKLADDFTYGSNLTITGNLDVNGTTTTVDSSNTAINDPLITLSRNTAGAPSWDAGILVERGTDLNAAWIFDETNDQWAAVYTTDAGDTNGAIAVSGYANIQVASVTSNGAGFGNLALSGNTLSATNTNGDVIIDPDGTGTVQIDALEVIGGTIDGTAIGGTTTAAGAFTSLDASGAVSGDSIGITNGAIIGGALTAGASILSSAAITNAASVGGTFGVTGATTLSSTLSAGASTLASLGVTNAATVGGTLTVTDVATFTAGAGMNASFITDVLDPVLDQDAATKAYVDSVADTGFTLTDGSTSTVISGGNTLTVSGTANEVEVVTAANLDTMVIGLPSNVTISNNLTVTGNTSTTDMTASGNALVTGTCTI